MVLHATTDRRADRRHNRHSRRHAGRANTVITPQPLGLAPGGFSYAWAFTWAGIRTPPTLATAAPRHTTRPPGKVCFYVRPSAARYAVFLHLAIPIPQQRINAAVGVCGALGGNRGAPSRIGWRRPGSPKMIRPGLWKVEFGPKTGLFFMGFGGARNRARPQKS